MAPYTSTAAQRFAANGIALVALVIAGSLCLAAQGQANLTGDRIPTGKGDLVVHPINHATFALGWDNRVVYIDPVGGADRFSGLPRPDLVLLTDIHGDHLDAATLKAVCGDAPIVAPPAVIQQMPPDLQGRSTRLANGESTTRSGMTIEAVAAYNITPDRLKFHAKGRGNGYVLSLGGKRVYISGDTEDVPEMRALKSIDVAFVCMNLPYTMTAEQAAGAVREFRPRVVYPYHSRGTDLERFSSLVGADSGIEVRIRNWY